MNKKIIIGSRGSKLSLSYAGRVKDLLLTVLEHKINVEITPIKTSGDILQEKKTSEVGGKNIFCKEIEKKLIDKKIDIAVHSLKDMDSFEEKNLTVAAYIKRNDPRDVLILNNNKSLDSKEIIIGSSSRRRELQFQLHLKNIKCKLIRGNVDNRISKVREGKYDGTILALAGIQTLKLEKEIKKIYPIEEIIPAAGQGIIAAQCRSDNSEVISFLRKINDKDTETCALTERSLIRTIGGDCHTAVGAHANIDKDNITLISQLFSDDGKNNFYVKKLGNRKSPTELGKSTGEELLKKSAGKFKKKR